jgi:hypothetical protein
MVQIMINANPEPVTIFDFDELHGIQHSIHVIQIVQIMINSRTDSDAILMIVSCVVYYDF